MLRTLTKWPRLAVAASPKFHCLRPLSVSAASYSEKRVRIGCASGFWGDTPTASAQLIKGGKVDYIILDYLSELTMSLLTAAMQKKPEMGYAPDLIKYAIGPNLKAIKEQGMKRSNVARPYPYT